MSTDSYNEPLNLLMNQVFPNYRLLLLNLVLPFLCIPLYAQKSLFENCNHILNSHTSNTIYIQLLKTKNNKHLVQVLTSDHLIESGQKKSIYKIIHEVKSSDCTINSNISLTEIQFVKAKIGKAIIIQHNKTSSNLTSLHLNTSSLYGVQKIQSSDSLKQFNEKFMNRIETGYKSSQLKTNLKQSSELQGLHLGIQFYKMKNKNIFLNFDYFKYKTNTIDQELTFAGIGISNPVYGLTYKNWIQGLELSVNYQIQNKPASTSLFNLSLFSQYLISHVFDLKINLGALIITSSSNEFPQNQFGSFIQMNLGKTF